jgi:hypothetical protein
MSAAVKRAVAAAKTRRLLKKWNGVKTTPARDADEPRDDEPASNPPAPAITQEDRARYSRASRDQQIAESKQRQMLVRVARKTALLEAANKCAEERAAVTRGCTERRTGIRSTAHERIGSEELKQREEKLGHRTLYPPKKSAAGKRLYGLKRGQVRYSAAESDSLALAGIPPRLHSLWKRERRRFPVAMQPDARTEAFLEWAETSEAEEALRLEAHELTASGYAAAERAAVERDKPEDEDPPF